MDGFAALLPRPSVPYAANERTMLLAWVDFHRSTLAMKCEGLTEAQLKQQPIATSTLSLLGLVRHITDVERHWIREILLGHAGVEKYFSDEHPEGEFDQLDDHEVEAVIATWRAEALHTHEIISRIENLDELCLVAHVHDDDNGSSTADSEAQAEELDLEAVRAWEDEGGSVLPPVPSVRWVLTHLIEEFARHNGHADLIRELIDGSTGD